MSAVRPVDDTWLLVYEGFDPQHEPLREALCTLGNGYFATRGAGEESEADEIHYPGTYLAGGYNRLDTEVAGRTVTNEDLVNFPNWLYLNFHAGDGEWFNPLACELLEYRQTLDMRRGLLRRDIHLRDRHGRETRLVSRRLVHMRQPHLAAVHWELTPLNWSGTVTVRSMLDGSVINAGVERYRELNAQHLQIVHLAEQEPECTELKVRTAQSGIEMAQVARTRVWCGGARIEPHCEAVSDPEYVGQDLSFEIESGQTVTVEKLVALHTSRDRAISEPLDAARLAAQRAGSFSELLAEHAIAWKHLWERIDVNLDAELDVQRTLRLHIFHLLQSVSVNSIDRDVGVPARGLHGEAYRGHIFWDELFIFPFYTFRIPEITRSLLMYRYHRLPEARQNARDAGYRGAMFPWQSGSSGREETQQVHLNPRSGRWGPDYSHLQRHVNAAIAYNLCQYFRLSDDVEFMEMYGAEMLLDIARFWSSIARFNPERDRYEIHGVMGPDEYHETYPDNPDEGLNNNAYTNVMAVWVLERALELLNALRPRSREELVETLAITTEELALWEDITRRMFVPFHDRDVISQFEGYERLIPFDWDAYRAKYGDIARLDRILKAEGDSPDRYQVSKQADVLMLFYLLTPKELKRIFEKLGYALTDEGIERNIEYYLQRTSHGSTLSTMVHASVLDRIERTVAFQMFCDALYSDVSDVQGGTTPEGIHLGAMAGTVDIVLRHYAGVDVAGAEIAFYPRLPAAIRRLHLRLRHRGNWFELLVSDDTFEIELDGVHPVSVIVQGQRQTLKPGVRRRFSLHPEASATGMSRGG